MTLQRSEPASYGKTIALGRVDVVNSSFCATRALPDGAPFHLSIPFPSSIPFVHSLQASPFHSIPFHSIHSFRPSERGAGQPGCPSSLRPACEVTVAPEQVPQSWRGPRHQQGESQAVKAARWRVLAGRAGLGSLNAAAFRCVRGCVSTVLRQGLEQGSGRRGWCGGSSSQWEDGPGITL